MAPLLYTFTPSPPCRSVGLLARHLGVTLDLVELDLMKGEHKANKEFLKVNPQHTVPTFVDGDIVLWESRAILQYLASSSPKGSSLYPSTPTVRAKVDQLLYFDMGSLYGSFAKFAYPVMQGRQKPDPEAYKKIIENLELLDGFLEGHFFAVGNRITIADFALVASVSTIVALGGVELTKVENVSRWFNRCKGQMLDYDRLNGDICEKRGKVVKPKLRF